MLSRVAERVYWLSRYLERVENSARLVAVYSELLLDLPEAAGIDWSMALEIMGMGDAYEAFGRDENELAYLLVSKNNGASVLAALNQARENARTTRDVVPSEAWRAVNELNIYAVRNLPTVARRPSSVVPAEIVGRCQEITGIVEGTMSHGPAYRFIRLGRALERADMCSRIIDVAASILLVGREDLKVYNSAVWHTVLRALSAYQMYSQYVRRRVMGQDVLAFLLNDTDFPRSIAHCVHDMEKSLRNLPRNEKALAQLEPVRNRLHGIDVRSIDHETVHRFADELQVELASLHGVVFETWLNPMSVA
jgi:uncharacterized alpha-E superfamily protein